MPRRIPDVRPGIGREPPHFVLVMPDDRTHMDVDAKQRMADAISSLAEREKLVVALYYYENLTLAEIGEVLGETPKRIEDLHRAAIASLSISLGLTDGRGEPRPAVVGPDGHPLAEGSLEARQLRVHVSEIGDELLAALAGDPNLLYALTPRRFEEVVAALYRRRGFDVTLTPSSRDGGVDVFVVRNDELGRSLHLLQCKRYAPGRRVGPDLVRELVGSIDVMRASTGVLITTSFFTKGARDLERTYEHRLSLKDFVALQELLKLPKTSRS